jgi:hypothetical protein
LAVRRPTLSKRQKERKREERKQRKAEKLARRRTEKDEPGPTIQGEDPDIAGIIPGPQPLPWEE